MNSGIGDFSWGSAASISLLRHPKTEEVFDQATQTALRKSLALQCRVVGLFPDPTLAPVETTLQVHIQVLCAPELERGGEFLPPKRVWR